MQRIFPVFSIKNDKKVGSNISVQLSEGTEMAEKECSSKSGVEWMGLSSDIPKFVQVQSPVENAA